jgi:hypothetical protein
MRCDHVASETAKTSMRHEKDESADPLTADNLYKTINKRTNR